MFPSTSKRRWLTSLSMLLLVGLAANDLLFQDASLQACSRRSYRLANLVEEKAPPAKTPSAEDQKKLQALLKERRDTLREVVEVLWKRVENGIDAPDFTTSESSRLLLQAELQLADNLTDRVAAHEKHVKLAKKIEDIVEAQLKGGKIRSDAYYRSQAARLGAEIDLVREKAGGKPTAEQAATIKKLLEARRDVLREEVEARYSRIKGVIEGVGPSFGAYYMQASQRLLQAELELTEKPADRVTLLEKQLALSREAEKILKSQADSGKVRTDVFDEFKAWRLLDEIALLREKGGAKPNAEQAAEIRKLLGERRDAREAVMNARLGMLRRGLVGPDLSLLEACRFHLQSDLELLDKAADRVAAHQKNIERLKEIEEITKKQKEAGKIRVDTYLQAKSARLEAEIGLLREQMK